MSYDEIVEFDVTPARAGVHAETAWMPAFAGMTH